MEIWGVVNVTPDSFSDGGEFFSHDAAIARGRELREQGATVLDVGGESTRPGAHPVGAEEELRRVLPVIEALASDGAVVSVDTYRADVAERAIAAGARIVNDVSGGLEDPRIFDVVAAGDAEIAIGHWRGPSADMYAMAQYSRVGDEVAVELLRRVEAARAAGVRDEQIILDPGVGFAKTPEQSWAALRQLDAISALGFRVLIGVSRKRMLAAALGDDASTGRRDLATAVASVLTARFGAYGVRVHDVVGTVDALAVLDAWDGAPDAASTKAPTADGSGMIELTGLRVFGHHGVLDFERENGQEFVVDLHISLPMAQAAETDDVTDTVHYGEVADRVAAIVAGEPVNLIETLAHRIGGAVLADERIEFVSVTVHKPQAPIEQRFDDVSVTVMRMQGAPRAVRR
ncbi:dihydropteroate synthase [Microbacterium sp. JB110]|uniref:dihydropteroate synthase n=1 Tax=Microbacterium sp. JB110 TaxID=2024477 RepID=UPI00097E9556|nr:Dihydropteroate synthase [Frigoribacterium sp. JB110]